MTGMPLPFMMMSAAAAERIEGWDVAWGVFDLRQDRAEKVMVVSHIGQKDTVKVPAPAGGWQENHYLRHAPVQRGSGVWCRVDPVLHDLHREQFLRGGQIDTGELEGAVVNGWRQPPKDSSMPVLTWSPSDDGAKWSLWWVNTETAIPGWLEIVDDRSPLEFLGDAWPVDLLGAKTVMVVGVGSIGSALSETLASYAVGRLILVDHDRLMKRNLIRHRLGARDLGRLKVNATRELLAERYPHVEVEAYPYDVIRHADLVRPLLARADLVVTATDGVASRRVVNHLARRAAKPAVLACVLEAGAFGEIVRVRAGIGCLLCYREHLEASGAIDPEPDLEAGYGSVGSGAPMTAVEGDLVAVAVLAAKVAVATLLEAAGHLEQRLPGDVAVLGLQPVPDFPAPFDVERAGEVRWRSTCPTRDDCPTCCPA